MKKIILFTISFFLCSTLFGQKTFVASGKTMKMINTENAFIEKNKDVNVIVNFNPNKLLLRVNYENKSYEILPRDLQLIEFQPPKTVAQAWDIISIKSTLFNNLVENGYQYDLRNDLDEESNDYLIAISKNGLWFEDAYLEDYIQSMLYKIHPITLSDMRPGSLNIKIVKSNIPNAYTLPNGTIIVNTGLLSLIDSEEELIAALAHEVAHFVLDHYIVNYNKTVQRENRAAFWAGVATAAAAITEGYLAYNNPYYVPGGLTLSTAALSTTLAVSISERLGLKYSREQENEADRAAVMILDALGIDHLALSSVLLKIQDYAIQAGDFFALSDNGTHPGLSERITAIGNLNEQKFYAPEYHQLISFVNTFNANEEYSLKHFTKCDDLVQKNINSGVATEDDYLLKAMVTRVLYDTQEKNMEALDYIQKAKSLNVLPNLFVFKEEGLTYLRLNNNNEANNAFQRYLAELESISDPNDFIIDEINWTKKMVFKVSKMQ
jgi:beta-barrel assembly-enhancing protease